MKRQFLYPKEQRTINDALTYYTDKCVLDTNMSERVRIAMIKRKVNTLGKT